ncbi:unnamed protein product [Hymenolepis diminuta]|uniref:RING-type domain-containing protein n=1 Tax=Hymenolepis diminuta TaxID=6216 RepID=A0A564XU34_HYMDI|nr:unnamed protein product [Hymenolepis diminuta]
MADPPCDICTEPIVKTHAIIPHCEHKFHTECLLKWTAEEVADFHCKCPVESCGCQYESFNLTEPNGTLVRCLRELKCPVCWEVFQFPFTIAESCGHGFCLGCLREFLKNGHICPVDRGPINGFFLFDNFNLLSRI